LKAHLIEMEETHTLELMDKETEIHNLQQKLDEFSLQESVHKAKEQQLEMVTLNLKLKETECERCTRALNDLQNVLEQMQVEQESQSQCEIILLKNELSKTKEALAHTNQQIQQISILSTRCSSAEQTVRQLQQELSLKTKQMVKSQEEVELMRKALNETIKKLVDISKNEESLVDKRLVSKLFITYFRGKTEKKDVLELIAKILNFTDDEKSQIGIGTQPTSWIPFFGSTKKLAENNKTLTDLWVDFLLKEATEQPK